LKSERGGFTEVPAESTFLGVGQRDHQARLKRMEGDWTLPVPAFLEFQLHASMPEGTLLRHETCRQMLCKMLLSMMPY